MCRWKSLLPSPVIEDSFRATTCNHREIRAACVRGFQYPDTGERFYHCAFLDGLSQLLICGVTTVAEMGSREINQQDPCGMVDGCPPEMAA